MSQPKRITPERGREAVQRLINSHFGNANRARCSIPANREHDDDLVACDYLTQVDAENKALREALQAARTNVAYAHMPENCGDHCRNNCRDCVLQNTLNAIDEALEVKP